MDTWIVSYSSLGKNSLLDDYITIEGKNALEALKNFYGVKFKRLTGESGRIMQKLF